ncbi:MAG: FtsX-like permease family protein [Candidatus Berkelbacteria bacterium]|nr:FtsX-like permease family protein [Candidatus Berkelbacteria bacterium]
MGTIIRGVKNAFRNNLRTLSIVLILSVSIAMSLAMFESLKTVQAKIDSVKSSIGNFVTVSPAGIRGFEGGGTLLTDDAVAKISQISGVVKVTKTLSDHLQTGMTNLTTPIEAGDFGNRQQKQSSQSSDGTSSSSSTSSTDQSHGFAMPIMVTASDDLSVTQSLNMSDFKVISGEKFDGTSAENIAMLGTDMATKNNLTVGQTFKAYNQDIKVVGIFDSGNKFGNTQIVMPLKTLQTLSSQAGQVNTVVVQTSSIDVMSSVTSAIKSQLGDSADVTSSQDTSNQAITPLENIKSISTYGLIGSLVAGAIILFLSMVMIVRERRREIGVLKAIGASNMLVVSQFAVESLILTLMSAVVGVIVGAFISNPILKVMATNNTQNTGPANPGEAHVAMMRVGAGIVNGAQGAVRNITATLDWKIVLYGLGAAIIIAIIGSALPASFISKVRPAEVLRSE